MHAFELQQIFGASDGILQSAIGVVKLRGLFEAPFLLAGSMASGQIWVEFAAECVEFALELRRIDIHLGEQSEEGEVVDWPRRLHVSAGVAKMGGTLISAGPTLRGDAVAIRIYGNCGCVFIGHFEFT
jgi:hypothetical protein